MLHTHTAICVLLLAYLKSFSSCGKTTYFLPPVWYIFFSISLISYSSLIDVKDHKWIHHRERDTHTHTLPPVWEREHFHCHGCSRLRTLLICSHWEARLHFQLHVMFMWQWLVYIPLPNCPLMAWPIILLQWIWQPSMLVAKIIIP
jgi:hypothetical protein